MSQTANEKASSGEASSETIALVPTTVPFPVPSAESHIVEHAQLDVNRWRSILSHKVVLEQGMILATASRGDVLFRIDLSPLMLKTRRTKSIVCHLAEMFSAWNGTLVFELVMTIPIFVVTKIVMAYLPQPRIADEFSVEELAGLQNSLVVNPQNAHSAILRCPFIADGNWLSTTRSTGTLVAALLENLVFSMEFNQGGIPWTLFVAADPNDFNFRYLIPPSTSVAPDSGQDGVPSVLDTMTALVSSTSNNHTVRAAGDAPLVRPSTASMGRVLNTMMLIPRTRVEYVMQKVRGQFSDGGNPTVIADMFDCPFNTLSTYESNGITPDAVYPYINRKIHVHFFESDADDPGFPNNYEDPVVCARSGAKMTSIFLVVSPDQAGKFASYYGKLRAYIAVPGYDTWYGATSGSKAIPVFVLKREISRGSRWYHQWNNQTSGMSGPGYNGAGGVRDGLLMSFVPSTNVDTIVAALRAVDDAPQEVTHLALYTTLPSDQAKVLTEWLITADNTSPPLFCEYNSISFSCNQAPLAYANSRLVDEPSSRGIVWRLFKLFHGDETKWWAWLVRGLDIVVDFLIGNFLGRDATQVVDISADSGFRWEAVGPFKPELVKPTSRVRLPQIAMPREQFQTVQQASLAIDVGDNPDPTPQFTRSATSKSPVSRMKSRSHQARHPSKKHWFRKDSELQSGP